MRQAYRGARGAASPSRVFLVSCLGVDLELALLPAFLDHYLGMGIAPGDVRLITNTADEASENLDAADRVLAGRGCPAARRWLAPYTSDAMWAERRRTQADEAGPGDWVVNADVDEFHRYPAPLPEVIAYLEARGAGALHGVMVDRLAPDGTLAEARPGVPPAEQYPVRADVSLSVFGVGANHGVSGTIKLMVHRGDVLPRRGGHTVLEDGAPARYAAGARLSVFPGAADPGWRADFPFKVDHYKWTGTLRGSLSRRLATKGVSVAGREYGGKIDRYLAEHGRVRLEDVSVFEGDAPPGGDWRARLDAMRRQAPYWLARNALRQKVMGARALLGRAA